MRKLFHEVLSVMENAFTRLEQQVPSPQRTKWADSFVYRYLEQSIEQALILKLARSISTLQAVDVLLLHGFLQEQASLLRILDEIHEDIYFLAAPLTNDQVTELHNQYLAAFFAEKFPDPDNSLARHKKPNLPPRRKIRSYVTRVLSTDPNPSKAHDVGETISSVYSGYVHASAPQTMDMYGGRPAHFHLSGMRGTPLMEDHIHDSWNYFYRGLMATTVVAKALGDAPLVKTMYEYMKKFEEKSGSRFDG